MKRNILISVLLFSLVLAVSGCSEAGSVPEPFEAEASKLTNQEDPSMVKIGDILEKPEAYAGQVVIVEGKIISQCSSGCWFTLNDGTGSIYIDLAPSDLVIAQKRGASARVTGEVVRKGGDTYLIGTKVEF